MILREQAHGLARAVRHRTAERLEREYGDDPERARQDARILGDVVEAGGVASNQDIAELRAELPEVEPRFPAELRKEIGAVPKEIGAVRGEMGALASKMAALLVAQSAVLGALMKLLPGGS